MKKNLRIVSVAAAALLAVAPVAASAVSVNAAANTEITLPGNSNKDTKGTITLSSNVKAVTFPRKTTTNNVTGQVENHMWDGSLNGNVTASYKGQSFTVNLGSNSVKGIYYIDKATNSYKPVKVDTTKDGKTIYRLEPGKPYYVYVVGASINMTTANANLAHEVLGSNGDVTFFNGDKAADTLDVSTNINGGVYRTNESGTANLGDTFDMMVKVVPTDMTNARSVSFFEKSTGDVVNAGSLDFTVGPNQTLNVNQLVAAFNEKYTAHQLEGNTNSGASVTTTVDDVKEQLAKQGMNVDANGNFTPYATFSLNFSAKSSANGATATMPVTVNVKGGKVVTPASVAQTGTVKIMHAAYTYEIKDGKLGSRVTSADTLHAYNVIPVYGTTTVNGKKYYRVSATQDWYINAGNVDGTSRTLNHNSYVYNNKGKRVKSEGTWKKGSKHTTYGAAMNIKGNRMYRVGENRYVKVVNFDKN